MAARQTRGRSIETGSIPSDVPAFAVSQQYRRFMYDTHLRDAGPNLLHVLLERRRQIGHGCCSDMVSNDEEDQGLLLRCSLAGVGSAAKEAEVYLKNGLQQTHVRALIQPDLVLPYSLSTQLDCLKAGLTKD